MALYSDPIRKWNFNNLFCDINTLGTLSTLIGEGDAFINMLQRTIPDVVFIICQDVLMGFWYSNDLSLKLISFRDIFTEQSYHTLEFMGQDYLFFL